MFISLNNFRANFTAFIDLYTKIVLFNLSFFFPYEHGGHVKFSMK